MLPESPLTATALRELLAAAGKDDQPWATGRGWSLVYDLDGEHAALLQEAETSFRSSNALSSSVFPSAARFESAVIAMVGSVVGAEGNARGIFTSGGSESLLMALKAHRDTDSKGRREVVMPGTAHPAVGKAAHLLGLTCRTVAVDPDRGLDVEAVRQMVNPSTLMLIASAPEFPFGCVDPIEELGTLALDHHLGLHVDAAIGGLFLPFLNPPHGAFGLNVAGVSSVSVDVHKYGYGAKGASVLLFADEALRRGSYYCDEHWPGGAYASAGVLGTRSVAQAAAAFTSLNALGRTAFEQLVAQVMDTAAVVKAGLSDAGFRVLGTPAMGVFAATGTSAAVAAAASGLRARGWWMDTIADPPALHFVVFPRHTDVAGRFLSDLQASLAGPASTDTLAAGAYGVMVRGQGPSGLARHLDERFDVDLRTWADP